MECIGITNSELATKNCKFTRATAAKKKMCLAITSVVDFQKSNWYNYSRKLFLLYTFTGLNNSITLLQTNKWVDDQKTTLNSF